MKDINLFRLFLSYEWLTAILLNSNLYTVFFISQNNLVYVRKSFIVVSLLQEEGPFSYLGVIRVCIKGLNK